MLSARGYLSGLAMVALFWLAGCGGGPAHSDSPRPPSGNLTVTIDQDPAWVVCTDSQPIVACVHQTGSVAIISSQWYLLSGPGLPTMDDPQAPVVHAVFPYPGTYVLMYQVDYLVAGSNVVRSTTDTVTIVVHDVIWI